MVCDDNKDETRRAKSALNAGIEAIVGKQPDAKQGLDALWVRGKAGFHYSVMLRDNDCYVECGVCRGTQQGCVERGKGKRRMERRPARHAQKEAGGVRLL